jgi:hypothetical protein
MWGRAGTVVSRLLGIDGIFSTCADYGLRIQHCVALGSRVSFNL